MQPSNVKMFFKDNYAATLQRTETHTIENFLAICGGLFGLFLGISALSIVEFIYYVTLRFYWRFRQKKSDNTVMPLKSGHENSVSIDMPSS